MDTKKDVREFLVSRRARLSPEDAGLPAYGTNRRVAGLRREEVALLAGISVEYYTRLERGSVGVVSRSVLDGLSDALQLDDAERDHLRRLIAALTPEGAERRPPARRRVRPTIQRMLDALDTPAYVRNESFDILAANAIGRALYQPVFDFDPARPNSARFAFLCPTAAEFFVDFDRVRADAVAVLRSAAGKNPDDLGLRDLVGELTTRSEPFARLWAAHNVRYHRSGTKRLHHPVVGDLVLDFEALELAGDAGQRLNVYTAALGSPAAESLALLASWASTPTRPDPMSAGHPTKGNA